MNTTGPNAEALDPARELREVAAGLAAAAGSGSDDERRERRCRRRRIGRALRLGVRPGRAQIAGGSSTPLMPTTSSRPRTGCPSMVPSFAVLPSTMRPPSRRAGGRRQGRGETGQREVAPARTTPTTSAPIAVKSQRVGRGRSGSLSAGASGLHASSMSSRAGRMVARAGTSERAERRPSGARAAAGRAPS